MARFEGLASIRRALSMPDGSALLDVKPDGSQWRWGSVPPDRARTALACGIAALTGGWKMYISLPDDPTSGVLEIVGLSKTADRPEAAGAGPAPGLLLHVKITPTPKAGKQLTYTVAVTDSSHTPVEQAAVRLHNYLASNADDIHVGSTDQNGVVSFTNLTLRRKTTTRRVEGELITTVTSPKLTVSKDGFDTVDITLV
jgi:hypothetical protein